LESVSALAILETIFSDGRPVRCGIAKMHYEPWGTCTAPALQELEERLKYFSHKYPPLNFSPDGSKSRKIALWMLRNTANLVFGPAIVRTTLVGTSSADKHHIYR
jgi:hypothetical protein